MASRWRLNVFAFPELSLDPFEDPGIALCHVVPQQDGREPFGP